MKRWLVLLLFVPLVMAQADEPVREVAFHQFHDVTFSQADFARGDCSSGGIELDEGGRAFIFREDKDPAVEPTPLPTGGYTSAGCGTVNKNVSTLPFADHLTIRFEADRQRADFELNAQQELVQDLVIRNTGGEELMSRAYFPPTEGSQASQPFEFTLVGEIAGGVQVQWVFEDSGVEAPGQGGTPASGQVLVAKVRAAVIEATGPAATSHVDARRYDDRDGTRLTTRHDVAVTAPDFQEGPAAVRLQVDPGLTLTRIVGPNGTALPAASTFEGGVLGRDHDTPVVELNEAFTQVTIPQSAIEAHGPGEYHFIFEQSTGLEVSPALLPFSIILLAAPLPFAILAWVESRAFRKEAFGGYARSARNLQYGVVLVFLYYVAVVASAAIGGRLDLMALVPLPLEGVLLYVQLVIAGVAFTALWLVARELYLLVRPRPSDDAL